METVFRCSICKNNFNHPDSAIDCEASHYDACGVCPKCDQSNAKFDKLENNKYVCRECKLIVTCIIDFAELCSTYAYKNAYARRCHSYMRYNMRELAWIMITGNHSDKARFYNGSFKDAVILGKG